jgi:hypothetical protein
MRREPSLVLRKSSARQRLGVEKHWCGFCAMLRWGSEKRPSLTVKFIMTSDARNRPQKSGQATIHNERFALARFDVEIR